MVNTRAKQFEMELPHKRFWPWSPHPEVLSFLSGLAGTGDIPTTPVHQHPRVQYDAAVGPTYEAKFHTLSRYATTQLLDTEKERIRLFMKGLKTNLAHCYAFPGNFEVEASDVVITEEKGRKEHEGYEVYDNSCMVVGDLNRMRLKVKIKMERKPRFKMKMSAETCCYRACGHVPVLVLDLSYVLCLVSILWVNSIIIDDTSQMATLIFEDMIGGHHLKAQDLVTPRAQEYARKIRFEHKQGRVWKIAWSIEDLRTHGFGQHLMGHDLIIFIKVNEDQTLVVGTQALVDPLDDEIDSPRESDLCPSGASTYNLTKVPLSSDKSIHTLVGPCEKQGESTLVCELPTTSEGEQNDQPGVDDLDLLEYLENLSCNCLCEDDFDCGPLASRDGLYVYEDNSCEREGLDSRSNPFQEGKDDTSQMATLIFEDMIGGHHLKAQDLVTPKAQEYARKTHFEHKQGRV
ncbi:hypothetical protein FXO37_26512 [Capsicum annuum]|nr:hypothetical protein FXO37_26512 [Capsicum annuum]